MDYSSLDEETAMCPTSFTGLALAGKYYRFGLSTCALPVGHGTVPHAKLSAHIAGQTWEVLPFVSNTSDDIDTFTAWCVLVVGNCILFSRPRV